MAWRCSGATNSELINNLYSSGLIQDSLIRDALLHVDRANYAPARPYLDSPQPIGHNATISAPHMHATALSYLLPFLKPAPLSEDGKAALEPRRALDIGSGSGYLTHAMAELALLSSPSTSYPDLPKNAASLCKVIVVGVEHVAPLQQLGKENVCRTKRGRELVDAGIIRFRVGDGRKGWVDGDGVGGPGQCYDAIHVGASAKEVHPELLGQLKAPGRMFIPLDDDDGLGGQHVWAIDKDADGNVSRDRLFGVKYVPLTDAAYYVED